MLWQAGQQNAECRVHNECAVVHSTGPASSTAEMMPARVIEDLRSRRHLISSAFRWKHENRTAGIAVYSKHLPFSSRL